METIVEKFILQLEVQLAERHVAITLTPEARAWLATEGLRRRLRRQAARARDPARGPRSADRQILFGELEHGGTVTIGVGETGLTFAYEQRTPAPPVDTVSTAR